MDEEKFSNPTNHEEEITANEAGQVKELLEKNLALTKEIHKMVGQIKRHINFQKVISFIYLLLIIVPIILGFIFLPPLLSGYIKEYQDLLGTDANLNNAGNTLNDLKAGLPANLQNLLK